MLQINETKTNERIKKLIKKWNLNKFELKENRFDKEITHVILRSTDNENMIAISSTKKLGIFAATANYKQGNKIFSIELVEYESVPFKWTFTIEGE